MIYGNKLLLKNTSTYKLYLSTFKHGINTETEESSLPYRYAKLTYNFSFKRGALQTGLGFETLKLPETYENTSEREMIFLTTPTQIKKIWLYPFYYNYEKTKMYIL
jgi:hypothetical protein